MKWNSFFQSLFAGHSLLRCLFTQQEQSSHYQMQQAFDNAVAQHHAFMEQTVQQAILDQKQQNLLQEQTFQEAMTNQMHLSNQISQMNIMNTMHTPPMF